MRRPPRDASGHLRRGAPGRLRRGAPGRLRHCGVRLRLTLLFGGLFLAAGAALLGITYGLVSSHGTTILVNRSSELPGGPDGVSGSALGSLPDFAQLQVIAARSADSALTAENHDLLLYSGIALAIMGAVSVALGWFAAGRALRPLRRITSAARRISASNLHERLAMDGTDDDLRKLADTIGGLFARLNGAMDAQRQFVANASHELRTPLARSRTLLEVALRSPSPSVESLRAACERVLAAGEESERLIEALLTLARGQRGLARRDPVDLAAVTHDVLAARGADITARGLEMRVTLAPALMAGDSGLAERAVANLIDNALRHNVADGAVWVSVGGARATSGSATSGALRSGAHEQNRGGAVLRVTNTGPLVPEDDIARLLQPFQRRAAARTGDGLGLGLSIVQAIAMAHGAALSLTPRPGGGLEAELAFPPPREPARSRETELAGTGLAGTGLAGRE